MVYPPASPLGVFDFLIFTFQSPLPSVSCHAVALREGGSPFSTF